VEADPGFWKIFDDSFPPEEKDPRAVVLKTAEHVMGAVFCSRLEGETLALAIVQHLREVPYEFLIYLAVAPTWKGQGTGGELLEFVSQALASSDPTCLGLVWEVDRPEDADSEVEMTKRARRIRFFERHSGRRLEVPYLQPALDGQHVVPMHLMTRSFPGAPSQDAASLRQLAHALYFEKYCAVNGLSPLHLEDLLDGRIPPRPAFPGAGPRI
jgi:GNAT superfamily N-acetyltransferase